MNLEFCIFVASILFVKDIDAKPCEEVKQELGAIVRSLNCVQRGKIQNHAQIILLSSYIIDSRQI